MSTDRRHPHPEDDEETLGVLNDPAPVDAAGIGLLGDATAQVPVALPQHDEDDDLVDDDVVEGEAHVELVLDADPAAFVPVDDGIGRIHDGADVADIVIELPADLIVVAELVEENTAADDHDADQPPMADGGGDEDAVEGSLRDAHAPDADDLTLAENGGAEPGADIERAEPEPEPEQDATVRDEEPFPEEGATASDDEAEARESASEPGPEHEPEPEPEPENEQLVDDAAAPAASADETVRVHPDPVGEAELAAPTDDREDEDADEATTSHRRSSAGTDGPVKDAPQDDPSLLAPMPVIALRQEPVVPSPAVDRTASAPADEEDTVTGDHVPDVEPAPASRRLDQFGDRDRESADLLTADRLLDPHQVTKPEPEGLWSHLLYTVSGRRINIGDGKRAKERKALSARIAAPLAGTARFVPVLSRKGGVGKTTVTALLGMALADAREDRVIAVDANPDRGTLADRIARTNGKTVRDLVRIHDQVTGYHDISAVVSRDGTRLDVLASDTDPHVSEAFDDEDYEHVASVAARYYSLVLTDTGTGIVHSVMTATLAHADTLVLVAGLSVDEARLASETLTWLETNGYSDKVRRAVVVLNQSNPGAPMVRLDELEAHFRTRVAHVLRIPYDSQIAAGSAITYSALQPETRQAARELAAVVVEGLRERAA